MYGIDIELGDYHIGSTSMDYDSQMGHYKACACEKSDEVDAGYASDKCRMVLATWDSYGMAMYVSDEVAGREEITKPDFATAKGKVYLFDAPTQQGSEDGNENERTKFDGLYGALLVSEDEDEDLDYSTNELPKVSSVTIFKAPEAKPEEHEEGIVGRSLGGSEGQDSAIHSQSAGPIEGASVPGNEHERTGDNKAMGAAQGVEEVPSSTPVLETSPKVNEDLTAKTDSEDRAQEEGQEESSDSSGQGKKPNTNGQQEEPGVIDNRYVSTVSDTGSIATGISQSAEQQSQNAAGQLTKTSEGGDSGVQGVSQVAPVPNSPAELDSNPTAALQPGAEQVALTSAPVGAELASSSGSHDRVSEGRQQTDGASGPSAVPGVDTPEPSSTGSVPQDLRQQQQPKGADDSVSAGAAGSSEGVGDGSNTASRDSSLQEASSLGEGDQEKGPQEVPGMKTSEPTGVAGDAGSIATGISQNAEQQPKNAAGDSVSTGAKVEGENGSGGEAEASVDSKGVGDNGSDSAPGEEAGASSHDEDSHEASSLSGEKGPRGQEEPEDDLSEEGNGEPASSEFSGLLKAAASIVGL